MYELKIRRVGNSLGLTLPKEAASKLNVAEGDTVFLSDAPDGFLMTPYDAGFAAAMKAFEKGERKYRNALRELAE